MGSVCSAHGDWHILNGVLQFHLEGQLQDVNTEVLSPWTEFPCRKEFHKSIIRVWFKRAVVWQQGQAKELVSISLNICNSTAHVTALKHFKFIQEVEIKFIGISRVKKSKIFQNSRDSHVSRPKWTHFLLLFSHEALRGLANRTVPTV